LALALLFPPRGLRWDIVTFNSLAATMPWHQVFTTLEAIWKPLGRCGFWKGQQIWDETWVLQQEFHPSMDEKTMG